MINQVIVVAMPDERLGERIAAFIVLKNQVKTLSLHEVTDFLATNGISKEHWPEAIKIVDDLPMTSSGKVQRFALREKAKEFKVSK